ncbi:HEAT repeat domain-containing protein [Gimesia panareensis]|uniref:HEAT repeat domain-containing protein n=1 Tax=Gimesia panareensis TaxID=2527978 RepID=UPI0018D5DAF5|nr:HEAT repeat domain-containing protein [Gimesia panareensis]
MQQQLHDEWTLDLAPVFSRVEREDGFIVFSKPDLEIWAVVYCEQPFDSEAAVRSYLAWRNPDESDVSFRPNSEGISGRAFLTSTTEGERFLAVAASLGRIIELDFRFQDKSAVETAVSIWHTLQHSPPAWVKQCSHVEPPLSGLREALERGTNIEAAIDDVLDREQTATATAVLLESVRCESATVRQASCDAFAILDDATEEVTDALRERLKDDVIQVRASAAEALLDLGAPAESVVPSLIEGLQKREAPLPIGEDRIQGVCGYLCVPDRYHAARILSAVGEAARPARDALLEHQLDESGDVRLQVAEALLNLGEPLENVLPPLRDGLHNPDLSHRERMRIAQSLLEHGESHNDVLPTVIEVLGKTTDDSARVEALEVLGQIGHSNRELIEAFLIELSSDADEETGHSIQNTLKHLREPDQERS